MAGIIEEPLRIQKEHRMQCYIPADSAGAGAQDDQSPFSYNPELNAGPVYTSDYQGPNYERGGVKIGKDFSVFIGVQPSTKAAECFASNRPGNISLRWSERVGRQLKDKLLCGDPTRKHEEVRSLQGKEEKVCVSLFNVPQRELPERYRGDLKNWEFGPCTEPLNLDFSSGINGEVGMITVGNNKHGGVPDVNRSNRNDNVMIVWDEELGKYVCQLDTYMIYKKVSFIKRAWTIKNTGGLITTRMYASGRYEVRAKVPEAPGLVWAIWTFWGNEIYSHCRSEAGRKSNFMNVSDSPMWLDHGADYGHLITGNSMQYPNHEIDIEIPSNAPQTVSKENMEKYNTMNLNCYRWTDSNGTGTYNNLFCHKKNGPFIGDGQYHTYRFDWHTGDGVSMLPRVDFYFDDNYIGTNDAFVPYMAGRLWIMFTAPSNGQPGGSGTWNGNIDQNFYPGQAKLGDIARYASVKVDYVRITPFGEPNDHYSPSAFDQPCMGTEPECVDCGRHNPDPRNGTFTSILPYTTVKDSTCGGIKWIRK